MDDADDAGRPLVARAAHPQLLDELRIRRQPGDRHRPSMRDVRHEGAQRDDQLDAEPVCDADDGIGEGAPADVRLHAAQQDEIALRGGDPDRKQRVRRPVDLAGLALHQADRRPVDLEVVELLRVDSGQDLGIERGGDGLQGGRGGARSVVPAGEGAHESGRAKLGRVTFPQDRIHAREPIASKPAPPRSRRAPELVSHPFASRAHSPGATARVSVRPRSHHRSMEAAVAPSAEQTSATPIGSGSGSRAATRYAYAGESSGSGARWSRSSTTSSAWSPVPSTRPNSCRPPTAPRRSWRASWSIYPARSTTPRCGGSSSGSCWAGRSRRTSGALHVLGPAITPTSAGSSSTPSPSEPWSASCASSTRGWTPTC